MIDLKYNKTQTSVKIYLLDKEKQVALSAEEQSYFKKNLKEKSCVQIIDLSSTKWIVLKDKSLKTSGDILEYFRIKGADIHNSFDQSTSIQIINCTQEIYAEAFLEGFFLSHYQFNQLKKKNKELKIQLSFENIDKKVIERTQHISETVNWVRDLVNFPVSHLNAQQLCSEIEKKAEAAKCKTENFGFKKIQSLKMGGILAVNKGSIDEPGFITVEWKPQKAVNKKPLILVGKGVVYDTGGLSLKDTANSMEFMKSDMAGGATVAGSLILLAKQKIPVHVMAIIPATDNRPGGNAYAPGDVIRQYDGTTVEVLNTDAEGRLILADAIAYAEQFSPELIFTVATLTGSSLRSLGNYASAIMGNDQKALAILEKSGEQTRERVAICPFWDEYKEELKSDIADLKNIGSPLAGHITAGKFLEHFSKSPFIHMDMAPRGWFTQKKDYHPKGGTGIGVRLLFNFVKQKYGL